MAKLRIIAGCVLIYALVSVLISLAWFRFSSSYDLWQIARQPAEVNGKVERRSCNHRGNCRVSYTYSVGGKTYERSQWDSQRVFRPGMQTTVTYRSDFPELATIGSLDYELASAGFTLLIFSTVLPALPGLILIAIYTSRKRSNPEVDAFLKGHAVEMGVHRFAYAAIWSIWSACMLASVVIASAACRYYGFLAIIEPHSQSIPVIALGFVGALALAVLYFWRFRIEVSASGVRTRSLIGTSAFGFEDMSRLQFKAGRNLRMLKVFGQNDRVLLKASSSLNGYATLAGLLKEAALTRGITPIGQIEGARRF